MCLEIFVADHPVAIRYEHEVVRFTSFKNYVGQYTFLLENRGHTPVSKLNVIYPKFVFNEVKEPDEDVGFESVSDVTATLNGWLPGFAMNGNSLCLIQADPNRPQFDRAPLDGLWLPGEPIEWGMPDGFNFFHLGILKRMKYGCWYAHLHTPLRPFESRWFSWRVEINGAGHSLGQTPLGAPVVLHQFASPVDVHRTLREKVETGYHRAKASFLDQEAKWYVDFANWFGLHFERVVDIEYFEMVVQPGNPADRLVLGWQMERDLRMRSGSPRPLDEGPLTNQNKNGELVYEWKSGSMLEPDHAWTDQGFVLHLSMAYRR
jgi:hypothetical protein